MDTSDIIKNPEFLITKMKYWSKVQPDTIALRYCDGNGDVIASITYDELNKRTYFISQIILNEVGLKINDTVLLVYPPSLDFIIIFLSCIRAGVIAVPVYPPDPNSLRKNLYLFESVQKNCEATIALTSNMYYSVKKLTSLKSFFSTKSIQWPDLKWIVTDNYINTKITIDVPEFEPCDSFTDDKLMFLQYTSGSTSLPKGVMISKLNLSTNVAVIVRSLKADTNVVVCSWLPQYHDMGLIGSNLACLFCGGKGIYFSPINFIKQPFLWLYLISKYHATHLQAPNFAYSLINKRLPVPSQYLPLDLSSLKHVFNAAEPIQNDVFNTFIKNMKEFKMPERAMVGGYGLAENCVYVADEGYSQINICKDQLELSKVVLYNGDLSSKSQYLSLHSCGLIHKNPEIIIKIVNTTTYLEEQDDIVGEIWISGSSKASGYYHNREQTEETFHALLENDKNTFYLRTGDQGFIHNNELYLCGRNKDLIIIRGRNHFPQDIEFTCCENPHIKQGSIAAFSIPSETNESLIIVTELRDTDPSMSKEDYYKSICKDISTRILTDHGISPNDIVIIQSKTISKTTSGKIQRNKVKSLYLSKQLSVLYNEIIDTKMNIEENYNNEEIERISNQNKPVSHEDGIELQESVTASNETCDTNTEIETQIDTSYHRYYVTSEGITLEKTVLHGENLYNSLLLDLAEISGIESYTVEDSLSLQANGMDSLTIAQYKGYIEQYYGGLVDDEIMFNPSEPFKNIIQIIDEQQDRDPSKIVHVQPEPTIDDSDILHSSELNNNNTNNTNNNTNNNNNNNINNNDNTNPNAYKNYQPPKRTFCDTLCCRVK